MKRLTSDAKFARKHRLCFACSAAA
jgi:uncharacterized protein (TIGR02594 family)